MSLISKIADQLVADEKNIVDGVNLLDDPDTIISLLEEKEIVIFNYVSDDDKEVQ